MKDVWQLTVGGYETARRGYFRDDTRSGICSIPLFSSAAEALQEDAVVHALAKLPNSDSLELCNLRGGVVAVAAACVARSKL